MPQTIKELFLQAKLVVKKKGLFYIMRKGIRIALNFWPFNAIRDYSFFAFYKLFGAKTFTFNSKSYNYFYHLHSTTWESERAIEIPIVWGIINNSGGKSILEVGNVLSHYYPVKHDILDKYEKAPNVINEDVIDFRPKKKYDLIISISTIEHVGFNEQGQDKNNLGSDSLKTEKAINNLKSLLSAGGKLIITVPVGYNPSLDNLLKQQKLGFTKIYCMKRISKINKWLQADFDSVIGLKFNEPYSYANALIVAIYENSI